MENKKSENNEHEELKQTQEELKQAQEENHNEKENTKNMENQQIHEGLCAAYTEINYIPNEYFYNSCDCDSCGCITEEEMICSCGCTIDTMDADGYDNSSCH